MDDTSFWGLISHINTKQSHFGQIDLEPLVRELSTQDDDVIDAFRGALIRVASTLETKEHFRASNAGGDDSFLYACLHVIAMGKEHYDRVVATPSLMTDESLEDLLGVDHEAKMLKDSDFEDEEDDGWLDV